jgi:hypothetical protein
MKKGRKSKTPKCFCKSMNRFNSIYPKLQKSSLDTTPLEIKKNIRDKKKPVSCRWSGD